MVETIDTPAPAEPAVEPTPAPAPAPAAAEPAPVEKPPAKPAAKTEPKAPAKPAAKAPAQRKSLVATTEAPETPPKKADDAGETPEGDAEASGPPETYDLRGADGDPLDNESAKAVSAFARKLGLTNEAAQAYVDHEIERTNAQQDAWQNEIRNHPKLGGENLDASLKAAARARAIGSESMQRMLEGPWGDHPAVFEYLVEVGNRVTPDKLPTVKQNDRKPPRTEQDELKELYPEDFKDQ